MSCKSASISRSIVAILMFTVAAVSIDSAYAMPKPQQTSKNSIEAAKIQNQKKAIKDGKQKAKDRKELTGRDHQGNHDSLTKRNKSGAKGDRHANGIKQAGAAGSSK